jgi:hypothetical protein
VHLSKEWQQVMFTQTKELDVLYDDHSIAFNVEHRVINQIIPSWPGSRW